MKLLLTLGLVVAIGLAWFFFGADAGSPSDQQSAQAERGASLNLRSESDRDRQAAMFARKTGVDISLMNPLVMDILAAFETGDKDLIDAKILEWLEKDEALLLASIEAFDNLDNIYGYGMRFPCEKVAEKLYENHGGEGLMELMAGLSRISNTVGEMTGNSFEVWGRNDLKGALSFMQENQNFDNETALIYLAEDQAEDGDQSQVVKAFDKLEDGDPRKGRALEIAYGAWMEKNPDAFIEYANTLEDLAPAANALNSFAVHAAQHDIETALEWAKILPDEDNRKTALASVVGEMAHQDYDRYQTWLSEQTFANDTERERFVANIESMREALQNFVPDDSDPAEFFNSTIGYRETPTDDQGQPTQ